MKYEYTQVYISFKDSTNHIEQLNQFGQAGWEAISAVKVDEHNIMYLFKKLVSTDSQLLKG